MTYEEARELIRDHMDYGGSLDSHGLAVAMSSPASGASEGQASDARWKERYEWLRNQLDRTMCDSIFGMGYYTHESIDTDIDAAIEQERRNG